jgi:hypothetical protein
MFHPCCIGDAPMAVPFDNLPRHRRLVWFLETALDCLEEALEINATLGVLPHWARTQLRTMADELAELFEHLEREAPGTHAPA